MAEQREIEINVKTGQATKNVDKLTDAIEGTNKEAKKTNQTMADLEGAADKFTGGFITGLKKGADALKGIGKGIVDGIKGLKTMRITSKTTFTAIKSGIAATGIGLLVLALGSLITYFTQSQKGADKLKVAFAAIGTTISVLVDRLSTFGGGLLKILSGDFSEGVDMLKGSFKGLGEEIRNETAAATELERANQRLQDREIAMIKTRAKSRRDIEAAKLASADQTKTTEERAAALQRAIDLEKKISEEEIAIAKERARIIREQNALGESTRADLQAEAEAEARVIELEAERDAKLKELVGTLSGYTNAAESSADATDEDAEAQKRLNEQIAKRNELLAQEEAKLQEDLAAQYDAILQAQESAQTQELNAVEDKYNQLLANAEKYGFDEAELTRIKNEEINAINKKYDDEDSARKKKKAQDDAVLLQTTLQMTSDALGVLRAFNDNYDKDDEKAAEKAFERNKRLQIAQAVVNTAQAVMAQLAVPQDALTGANFVKAAIAAATGVAQVAKIKATEYEPSGGTTTSTASTSLPRPSISNAPQINIPRPQGLNANIGFDTSGANLGNQIVQSLQGQPMRAYVVNQDIQSTQKLDRKIEETATFG